MELNGGAVPPGGNIGLPALLLKSGSWGEVGLYLPMIPSRVLFPKLALPSASGGVESVA
jgi:hypothetical protein